MTSLSYPLGISRVSPVRVSYLFGLKIKSSRRPGHVISMKFLLLNSLENKVVMRIEVMIREEGPSN